MRSQSILSNYLGSMLGLLVSKGLRFVGVVYCVRTVGDQTWGQTVSTLALVSFLTLLMDQGLGAAPLLYRLRDRAADARLLRIISGYRLLMAGLVIAILHAIHRIFIPLDDLMMTYALVLLPRALSIDWWFHRRERYQFTTYLAALRTLVFFALVVLFVKPDSDATVLLYIEMGSEALAITGGWLLRRAMRSDWQNEAPAFSAFDLIRFSWPFMLMASFNSVQASLDIVVVRFLAGAEATARYDMGIKICFLYFFVGATLVQILRPKITRLHQEGQLDRLGSVLRTASSHLALASSLLLLPSLYFSRELTTLLYGRQADLTTFVFQWGPLWVGASFVSMLTADTLLSLGKRRHYLWGAMACAVTNGVATFLFVKLFSGQGALLAKLLSELVFLVIAVRLLPREVFARYKGGVGLQLLTLGALTAIYLIFEMFGVPLAGLAVSIGLLAVMAWRRRIFSRETLSVIREN